MNAIELQHIDRHRPHGQGDEIVYTLTFTHRMTGVNPDEFDVRASVNPPGCDEDIVIDSTTIPCTAPGDLETRCENAVVSLTEELE